jgi:hypothetical protein
MSPTLTGRAPLRIPRRAEVVASARGWHLAVAHAEPDSRRQPKYYLLDRRKCLELLLAVRRAWWRIEFQRAARGAAPGARLEGLYVSSELVEVRRDLLGDHVRVLGVKLRRAGRVRAFRRGLLASMRLGRRFSAELAASAGRLAWPAPGAPAVAAEAAPATTATIPSRPPPPDRTAAPPGRRAACQLPRSAGARVLAMPGPHHHQPGAPAASPALAPPDAAAPLLLAAAAEEPDPDDPAGAPTGAGAAVAAA